MSAPKSSPWADVRLPDATHPWAEITCAEYKQEVAAYRRQYGDAATSKGDCGVLLQAFGGRVRLATLDAGGRCWHQRAGKSAAARMRAGEGR